ncbi:cobalamin biosynthesis protein CobQ [Photobacterium galatheae]|uniref:Cobalamin biosynthesis protein CobQ n=1 Tax=Photobacterium galatheae TaxID=1654360 RepID=A0A066RN24_9GAMM|nr:cobalamin biosynthesis protein CobQ [Photobacterium galatheae]KDM91729.1 cobalamin biosynthesis protein CobQ [Photobacterium galatheae]MCM0149839.1 cobalamin biosynthesis protein CobQ [Photobacterium galatheae]
MAELSIEVFPVDNGDMTLITTKNNKKILIDCYRRSGSDYKYLEDRLRDHLNTDEDGRLFVDVFVLTHPDADHITGFDTMFHTGDPDSWSKKSNKIIIHEIWSSPRVFRRATSKNADGNNTLCDDAVKFNTEAKRRVKLYRENEKIGEKGNRILILSSDEDGKTDDIENIVADLYTSFHGKSGIDDDSLSAFLLGPADKQEVAEDEEELTKNNSSAIIRFDLGNTIQDKKSGSDVHYTHSFLVGGDAEVKCWEVLHDKLKDNDCLDELNYDVLLAPHHCSWRSLSNDSESQCDDPKVSNSAHAALSRANEDAVILCSSQEFGKDSKTPPSKLARKEYENILNDKDQFFAVAEEGIDSDENPNSLMITFSTGTPKKVNKTENRNFSKVTNPAAVKKGGKSTYA